MVTQERTSATEYPRIAYTVTQAAQLLRCHREVLLESLRAGEIKGFRIGPRGQWWITKGTMAQLTGIDVEDLP